MDSPAAERWAKARSFHHSAYPVQRIAAERAERRLSVSVCLPAREYAGTVGEIVGALVELKELGEVDALLAEHGHEDLRLVDNGVVNRRSPALAELEHVRGYHLLPGGASKAGGVAWHRRARGYAREETFAVGDSREDLACAAQVSTFWLVANAVQRDPSMREALAKHENARVTEAGHGAGVCEAVVSTLMG